MYNNYNNLLTPNYVPQIDEKQVFLRSEKGVEVMNKANQMLLEAQEKSNQLIEKEFNHWKNPKIAQNNEEIEKLNKDNEELKKRLQKLENALKNNNKGGQRNEIK